MEGLSPLHRRVAGIDVHRLLNVITVLIENEDGTITKRQSSFGGFKRDMRDMVFWLLELQVGLVVMESTGIYWKIAYSHLERAGIFVMVVNAHFINLKTTVEHIKIPFALRACRRVGGIFICSPNG